jgi:hypothetical protein
MKRKFMTYEGIPFRSALRPFLCEVEITKTVLRRVH